MKGNASFPMCGFSGRAIQILKACGVDPKALKTVNVLEDDGIRQGIKEYSNWPTIPQLYVKGEFIGGSDIMMEMYESGELQTDHFRPGLIHLTPPKATYGWLCALRGAVFHDGKISGLFRR
jgi:monothiol glutaredoxin